MKCGCSRKRSRGIVCGFRLDDRVAGHVTPALRGRAVG
jgi:hypothetical protein